MNFVSNIFKKLFTVKNAANNSLATKFWIILSIVLILFIGYFAIKSSILNNNLNQEKLKSQIYKQNWKAYEDSVNMKAKIIQEYAIKIENLNKENDRLVGKIIALQTTYVLLFDSIKILNEQALAHNFGDSIIVEFKGKKGRISYKGNTTYFVIPDSGTYSLSLTEDPIKIVNNLFIDSTTGIIYSEIYADSVLIDKAETKIDSALYAKLFLANNKTKLALDFWDRLSFQLETNQTFNIDQYKSNITGEIGIQYQFPSNISIKINRDFLNGFWITGVKYEISPGYIFRLIF